MLKAKKSGTQVEILETGEIITITLDSKPSKKYIKMYDRYFWINQDFLGELSKRNLLTPKTYQFLIWLSSMMEKNNKLPYTRSDLERMEVFNKTSVKEFLKQLVELNILILDKVNGTNKYYRINSHLMWKGSPKNWTPELVEDQLKL